MPRNSVLPPAMKPAQSSNFGCRFQRNRSTRLIHALLAIGRPATVTRLIVPARVNAINRFTVRSFTHISEKLLETISPNFTNGNSGSPVLGIARMLFVGTPRDYRLPASIGPRPALAVGSELCSGHFVTQTSTRLDQPAREVVTDHGFSLAAITQALPNNFVALFTSRLDDSQPGKALPSQVLKFWHD